MNNLDYKNFQQQIISALNVQSQFNLQLEVENRINFLKNYLRFSLHKALILGISGGIDSTVTGRLAQIAVEQLRAEDYSACFIALRLPYGEQLDEQDAQEALDFIKPDKAMNINIKQACDLTLQSMEVGGHRFLSESQQDFILGNIKARQRMIVQYALAGSCQGLVIGTDHAAEALMGFFTKFGDGASDVAPLNGLTKGRIKKIGDYLGAPSTLVNKKPTADLENLRPQRLDEDVYGITYTQIDNFLEGNVVSEEVYERIIKAYSLSEHKRNLPVIP